MVDWIDLEPVGKGFGGAAKGLAVMTVRQHRGGHGSGSGGTTAWITMRGAAWEMFSDQPFVVQLSADGDRLRLVQSAQGRHRLSRIGKHQGVGRLTFRAPAGWPAHLPATELQVDLSEHGVMVALLPDWDGDLHVYAKKSDLRTFSKPDRPSPPPPEVKAHLEDKPVKQPLAAGSSGPKAPPTPPPAKLDKAPFKPSSVADQLARYHKDNLR